MPQIGGRRLGRAHRCLEHVVGQGELPVALALQVDVASAARRAAEPRVETGQPGCSVEHVAADRDERALVGGVHVVQVTLEVVLDDVNGAASPHGDRLPGAPASSDGALAGLVVAFEQILGHETAGPAGPRLRLEGEAAAILPHEVVDDPAVGAVGPPQVNAVQLVGLDEGAVHADGVAPGVGTEAVSTTAHDRALVDDGRRVGARRIVEQEHARLSGARVRVPLVAPRDAELAESGRDVDAQGAHPEHHHRRVGDGRENAGHHAVAPQHELAADQDGTGDAVDAGREVHHRGGRNAVANQHPALVEPTLRLSHGRLDRSEVVLHAVAQGSVIPYVENRFSAGVRQGNRRSRRHADIAAHPALHRCRDQRLTVRSTFQQHRFGISFRW